MPRLVFRFAPSPNGLLHLGHAYSALLNFELARRTGGRFLLRIEDIDATRCRPEFETAIHEDLGWLGIRWEEPVRRQSEHLAAYREALRRLSETGLLYPAFMSRAEIAAATREPGWPRDPDGAPLYPGSDRSLPEAERRRRIERGDPYALRLDVTAAATLIGQLSYSEIGPGGGPPADVPADLLAWGDVVIARREIPTSYHLAVVLDDALQGITHVVRGTDLRAASAVHRALQCLLRLPAPVYLHHRLIVGADGRKLSKSARDTGLAALRQAGVTAAEVRRLVGIESDVAAIVASGAFAPSSP